MLEASAIYDQLPADMQQGLEQLCGHLHRELGNNVKCVALYGSLAKGQPYLSGRTAVRVVIVLSDANLAALAQIAPAVQHAVKTIEVVPFVVSMHDIETSADVFPIKLADMQAHHLVLLGSDVLSGLQISTEHLRLRAEQEVKNLMIRLRNAFLRSSGDEDQSRRVLERAIEPFFNTLAAIVNLKTGLMPASFAETIDVAASSLGVDEKLLQELNAVWEGDRTLSQSELTSVYAEFLESVEDVARLVDRLERESNGSGG